MPWSLPPSLWSRCWLFGSAPFHHVWGYILCSPRQLLCSHYPSALTVQGLARDYLLLINEMWGLVCQGFRKCALASKKSYMEPIVLLLLDLVMLAWYCWKCNSSCNHEGIKLTTWGWQRRKVERYPWKCNRTTEVINHEVLLPSTCNFMK